MADVVFLAPRSGKCPPLLPVDSEVNFVFKMQLLSSFEYFLFICKVVSDPFIDLE